MDYVQLTVRQRHRFRETSVDPIDFVDYSLGRDNLHSAHDLYRSIVDRKALPDAGTGCEVEGTTNHFLPTDVYMDSSSCATDIPKTQLGIDVHVVVPGQPVNLVQLAIRQSHHLREASTDVI